jgi:hypothetical protein
MLNAKKVWVPGTAVAAEAEEIRRNRKPLNTAMIETLRVLRGYGPRTHEALAERTGRRKGNKLRTLRALGFVEVDESERAWEYSITREGTEALRAVTGTASERTGG